MIYYDGYNFDPSMEVLEGAVTPGIVINVYPKSKEIHSVYLSDEDVIRMARQLGNYLARAVTIARTPKETP